MMVVKNTTDRGKKMNLDGAEKSLQVARTGNDLVFLD